MNLPETLRSSEKSTSLPDNPYTYEHFAKQPEYVQVNRELVQVFIPFLPKNFLHVDVATGTGLVPKLLIEEAGERGHKGIIIGVDPNATSLDIARKTTPVVDNISVHYIKGLGQNLKKLLVGKIPEEDVDGVSIHDALHEIRDEEDKITTVRNMANILKPGGLFSFNSAFTTEAIRKEPRRWAGWKMRAMQILGGERDKQVKTMPIYTPDKYKEMMQTVGLRIIHEMQKQVMLSKEALKAISMYPAFIKGVFEDMKGHENISDKDKSDALIRALDTQNINALPRIWYEILAQKPTDPLTT